MPYNLKSGRWGQRRSAGVGVPTNPEMGNENSILNSF